MKQKILILISMMLLLACIAPAAAFADSKAVEVRYSVSAKVIFVSLDGTRTTQTVDVGNRLKEPAHQDLDGYRFLGWKNAITGKYWDFNDPVDRHMTLTAVYEKLAGDDSVKLGGDGLHKPLHSAKTGDEVNVILWLCLCIISGMGAFCFYNRKKQEH